MDHSSPTLALTAPPDGISDEQRRADLVVAKTRATGLLVLATLVFLATRIWGGHAGWIGYVEAGAEAAMVGGLADWFAVVALFRHPLGLPIPHTAIIPKRKASIGESLGEFVNGNFLDPTILRSRIDQIGVASKVGDWLTGPGNARRVSAQLGPAVSGVLEVVDDSEVRQLIDDQVTTRLLAMDAPGTLARMVEAAVSGGQTQILLDAGLRAVQATMAEPEGTFRRQIRRQSPWWVPEQVDDRVFEKANEVAARVMAEVLADPHHDIRRTADVKAAEFADRLRTDAELARRVSEIRDDLVRHPELRQWIEGLWDEIEATLLASADDADSPLATQLAESLESFGERLGHDAELAAKVDDWAGTAVTWVAQRGRGEVVELIASTIERWDADETSERIELQVGRDLQFIRINGTLVGGTAGLVIHAVGDLIG